MVINFEVTESQINALSNKFKIVKTYEFLTQNMVKISKSRFFLLLHAHQKKYLIGFFDALDFSDKNKDILSPIFFFFFLNWY